MNYKDSENNKKHLSIKLIDIIPEFLKSIKNWVKIRIYLHPLGILILSCLKAIMKIQKNRLNSMLKNN